MGKHVKEILRRGQRGFTLIELVAVMAILAILVAIVAPAAINTERASISAQAQADSQQVRNAATDYFTRQNESEVTIPHSVDLTTDVNGDPVGLTEQRVSTRWPEMYITHQAGVPNLVTLADRTANSKYSEVFETAVSPKVVNVVLKDRAGNDISGTVLLTRFTAIDLAKLQSKGLLNKLPDGIGQTSTALSGLEVPNFLWLFVKQSSSLGTDDDRAIAVFALQKVQQIEPVSGGAATTVELTYVLIFGP